MHRHGARVRRTEGQSSFTVREPPGVSCDSRLLPLPRVGIRVGTRVCRTEGQSSFTVRAPPEVSHDPRLLTRAPIDFRVDAQIRRNHPSRCVRSLESAVTLGSFPVRHPTSESAHRAAAPKGNHPSRCARRLESAVTLGAFPVRHPTSSRRTEPPHRRAIILHGARAAWSQP